MTNGNYPTCKDKVEIYLGFYRDFIGLFNARRNYEWKVNLSLWAAVAILAGWGLKQDLGDTTINGYIFVGFHFAVWVLYAFLWSPGVHGANRFDRNYAFAYKKTVEEFLAGKNPQLPVPEKPNSGRERPSVGFRLKAITSWSPMFQILITTGLLAMSVFIHWGRLVFLCPCCGR